MSLCRGLAFCLTTTVRDCARQWLDGRCVWCHDTCALFGALCGVGFLCAGVRRSQTFAFVDVTGDEVFDFLQDVFSVDSLAQRRYTRVGLGGDAFALDGLDACSVTRIAHLFPVFSGRASAEKDGVLVSLTTFLLSAGTDADTKKNNHLFVKLILIFLMLLGCPRQTS